MREGPAAYAASPSVNRSVAVDLVADDRRAEHDREAGAVPARIRRGSSTGSPVAVAPTGRGPIQATVRSVSPLRNRWARTPPVARPFAGYALNGVTFTVASVEVTTIGSP